jgi:hypothetical protein
MSYEHSICVYIFWDTVRLRKVPLRLLITQFYLRGVIIHLIILLILIPVRYWQTII